MYSLQFVRAFKALSGFRHNKNSASNGYHPSMWVKERPSFRWTRRSAVVFAVRLGRGRAPTQCSTYADRIGSVPEEKSAMSVAEALAVGWRVIEGNGYLVSAVGHPRRPLGAGSARSNHQKCAISHSSNRVTVSAQFTGESMPGILEDRFRRHSSFGTPRISCGAASRFRSGHTLPISYAEYLQQSTPRGSGLDCQLYRKAGFFDHSRECLPNI